MPVGWEVVEGESQDGTSWHGPAEDLALTNNARGLQQQVDGIAGEQGHRCEEETAGGEHSYQWVTAQGSDMAVGQTPCRCALPVGSCPGRISPPCLSTSWMFTDVHVSTPKRSHHSGPSSHFWKSSFVVRKANLHPPPLPPSGAQHQQSRQTYASNGHCSASRTPLPASPQVRHFFLACTHQFL